eukprot:jgi/Chlat1/7944/Chrsp68S00585
MRGGMLRRLLAAEAALAGLLLAVAAASAAEEFCSIDGQAAACSSTTQAAGKLLVKGGTIVNADRAQLADVYIVDGVITALGLDLKVPDSVHVIDAKGKYVMPGGIDPHTHLAMPFMGTMSADDFYSGQAAALAGGTTMHIDFVLPIGGDLMAGWEAWKEKAKVGVMDYGFHVAVFSWNDKVKEDMGKLVKEGVNSFKFFLAYKNAFQVTDEELIAGLRRCKELGALPQVHCENGDGVVAGQEMVFAAEISGPEGHALSRPAVLEGEATGRAIRLAKFVNVPLNVVHVMSKDALEEVAKARIAGQRVIGEAVASGLVLDETLMWHPDFDTAAKYVMSPPIRSREHGEALVAALSTGILQLVGTDHCTFNSTQKARGRNDFRLIPNGVNGIEERMIITWDALVNSGRVTPSDYVRVTSTACAQIFNLYPRKGSISVGADADIIVLNPKGTTKISAKTHHSKTDTNVYEGFEIKGKIETTISRGRVVWHDDKLDVRSGSSRFVPMKPFMSLFDGLAKLDTQWVGVHRSAQ